MVSNGQWKRRYRKFLDNPKAVIPFIKKRLYYNRIADNQIDAYKDFQYLDFNQTIDTAIEQNLSLVRFGDELFDMLQGIGLYYGDWRQKYDPGLAKRMEEVISSKNPHLLVCFNPHFILKTKDEFLEMGIPEQHHFWTNSKMFLKNYYHPGQVYGNAHCFTEKYNKKINYKKILSFLSTKHVVVVTSNTKRFGDFTFGRSATYIESPTSDAWDHYDDILRKTLRKLSELPKNETIVLASLGSAAKVLVYDLTDIGYTAWDTGQLFDYAFEKMKKTVC